MRVSRKRTAQSTLPRHETTHPARRVGCRRRAVDVGGAQPPAAPAGPRVIDIQKLKDNLYVLTTSTPGNPATFSGGNVAVFITDGGVTLVDTKLAGWGQAMLDKVKSVTDKPVTTHHQHAHARRSHRQQRVLRRHRRDRRAREHQGEHGEDGRLQGRQGARFLPKKTYKDKLTVGSGKDRIDLYYFGAGPHQRRHLHRVPGAARPAHRRHVRLEGRAVLRSEQRRQLHRVAADAAEGDRRHQGHRHDHPGPQPDEAPKDLQEFQRFTADLPRTRRAR